MTSASCSPEGFAAAQPCSSRSFLSAVSRSPIDRQRALVTLLLLWLLGINLRTVVLGVPPTLPALHRVIGLSYSAGGLLSSLPVLLMALGAIPGTYLISRVGPRRAVAIGLALLSTGAALRAAIPAASALFLFTVVLAVGIALSQPAIPGLAQQWFPASAGRAVAVYSNGLLIGEVIAAGVTLPLLIVPFGWQAALAAWAIPAALLFALWLMFAPPVRPASSVGVAWMPDWRSGSMLRIGFLMGSASLIYFGTNAWIPDTLDARGAHSLIAPSLAALNGMQLPVSFLLTIYGQRLLGRRWPYVLAAIGSIAGVGGYVLLPVSAAPYLAGLIGVTTSLAFVLTLGLPALLEESEVARTSGFMLTIGYGTAFFGPAVGGILWDLSGHLNRQYGLAMLPMFLSGFAMLVLGITLPEMLRSRRVLKAG